MTKVEVYISEKNKSIIQENPYLVEELISEYIEKQEDKNTKNFLENSKKDKELNLQLKTVLWI